MSNSVWEEYTQIMIRKGLLKMSAGEVTVSGTGPYAEKARVMIKKYKNPHDMYTALLQQYEKIPGTAAEKQKAIEGTQMFKDFEWFSGALQSSSHLAPALKKKMQENTDVESGKLKPTLNVIEPKETYNMEQARLKKEKEEKERTK